MKIYKNEKKKKTFRKEAEINAITNKNGTFRK